ncbi:MAG: hypothetical protein WBF53_12555, partial [Litorimonas sp.]
MSDITKKIFSIDPEPDEAPLEPVPAPEDETPMPELREAKPDAVTFRPILDVVEIEGDDVSPMASDATGETAAQEPIRLSVSQIVLDPGPEEPTPVEPEPEPVAVDPIVRPTLAETPASDIVVKPVAPVVAPLAPVAIRAMQTDPAEPSRIGWVGVVLSLLTALAVGALVFAYVAGAESISAFGYAALILAIIVPSVAVIILWTALRALSDMREQSLRLARTADALTSPADGVADEAARLVDRIQSELGRLDARLAATRSGIEDLARSVAAHETSLTATSQQMAERSSQIAQASAQQTADLDRSREALAKQQDAFAATMGTLRGELDGSIETLADSAKLVGQSGTGLRDAALETDAVLRETAQGLSTRAEGLSGVLDDVEARIGRRTEVLSELASALDTSGRALDASLDAKANRIAALDSETDAAEARLVALLDRATELRDEVLARLGELESALEEFQRRAEPRMARSAEDRTPLKSVEPAEPSPEPTPDPHKADSSNIPPIAVGEPKAHALDLVSVDEADLRIPDEPEDAPLELSTLAEVATASTPPADVLRRPGGDASARSFGKAKKSDEKAGWRWRDMLGGLELEQA